MFLPNGYGPELTGPPLLITRLPNPNKNTVFYTGYINVLLYIISRSINVINKYVEFKLCINIIKIICKTVYITHYCKIRLVKSNIYCPKSHSNIYYQTRTRQLSNLQKIVFFIYIIYSLNYNINYTIFNKGVRSICFKDFYYCSRLNTSPKRAFQYTFIYCIVCKHLNLHICITRTISKPPYNTSQCKTMMSGLLRSKPNLNLLLYRPPTTNIRSQPIFDRPRKCCSCYLI